MPKLLPLVRTSWKWLENIGDKKLYWVEIRGKFKEK